VAVTGAILIGLGFSPLAASGLSLIANTAPVAYGALGTPIAASPASPGIDPFLLGAMVGRQLSVLLSDRAVLADLGVRRLARHDADLARHPGHRRFIRDPANSRFRTTSTRGSSTSAPR